MIFTGSGNANRLSGIPIASSTPSSGDIISYDATTQRFIFGPAVLSTVTGGSLVSSTLTLRSTSAAGTTDAIIFQVGSQQEAMRITSGRNVGILTNNPGAALQVAGTTSFGASSANSTGSGYVSSVTGAASKTSTSDGLQLAIFSNDALASNPLMLTAGTVGNATAANRYASVQVGEYGTGATPALVLQGSGGNVKIGGTALRATTEGSRQLVIFDGTAPVGTLANGCSFYSTAGEMRVMDAAGNATLLSPHDKTTNEWIYDSSHTPTGKRLKINVEQLLRFINTHFGLDFVHEFVESV
jgi:hypothetical protein